MCRGRNQSNKIMNNKYLLLIIGLLLIGYSIYSKNSNNLPIPTIPVVVPSKPPLKTNIYYDEYEQCLKLAQSYDKNLVIIFGAEWCPYCKSLKKDLNNISSFAKYIVCFIDTDKNEALIKKYRIKGLPTSVIVDYKEKELSRKIGYKNKDYNEWLENNLDEGGISWMPEK